MYMWFVLKREDNILWAGCNKLGEVEQQTKQCRYRKKMTTMTSRHEPRVECDCCAVVESTSSPSHYSVTNRKWWNGTASSPYSSPACAQTWRHLMVSGPASWRSVWMRCRELVRVLAAQAPASTLSTWRLLCWQVLEFPCCFRVWKIMMVIMMVKYYRSKIF